VEDIAPSKTDSNDRGVSSGAKPNPPAVRQRVRSSTTQDKEKPTSAPDDLEDAARRLHELDLYDFKDSSSFTSSPADQQSHIPSAAKSSASAAPARSHRRHSSIPKETMKSSAAAAPAASVAASDVERTKSSSSTGSTGRTSAASRRRSMMT
jgi:hypothetical protein